jgi:hypothetical protein
MNWKQYRLLFHWPLPLAVVAITTYGAVVSPEINIKRLLITYLLILFGLVFAAYSFDALVADWKDKINDISSKTLLGIALLGITGFFLVAAYAIIYSVWWGVFVALILAVFVICYNLEKPKWFHNKWGFAVGWGAVPIMGSYLYQSLSVNWIMLLLFLVGILLALQEWYLTNTKARIQKDLSMLKSFTTQESELLRKDIRKQTFWVTSLFCYVNFTLSMTLLVWRIYG